MGARGFPDAGDALERRGPSGSSRPAPRPPEADLRALALRLQEIREEERKELAHEIHDVLGQELTMLKLDVVRLLGRRRPRKGAAAAEGPRPEDLVERIDRLMGTVRRLSSDLRPPVLDYAGLVDALEGETARFAARTDLAARFESTLTQPVRDTGLSPAVFRILQESLTTGERHARARRVDVRLFEERGLLHLEVRDDGIGFDPSSLDRRASLGILGMQERAAAMGGTLGIESETGRGTVVRLTVPPGPADQGGPP